MADDKPKVEPEKDVAKELNAKFQQVDNTIVEIEHFYSQFAGIPGHNPYFFLASYLTPLKTQWNKGKRTPEIAAAILKIEKKRENAVVKGLEASAEEGWKSYQAEKSKLDTATYPAPGTTMKVGHNKKGADIK